jgi:hypothetical protein
MRARNAPADGRGVSVRAWSQGESNPRHLPCKGESRCTSMVLNLGGLRKGITVVSRQRECDWLEEGADEPDQQQNADELRIIEPTMGGRRWTRIVSTPSGPRTRSWPAPGMPGQLPAWVPPDDLIETKETDPPSTEPAEPQLGGWWARIARVPTLPLGAGLEAQNELSSQCWRRRNGNGFLGLRWKVGAGRVQQLRWGTTQVHADPLSPRDPLVGPR